MLQKGRCGKPTCRCARGSGELHGPYWYLYWKKDGQTKSRYVGKSRPAEGVLPALILIACGPGMHAQKPIPIFG